MIVEHMRTFYHDEAYIIPCLCISVNGHDRFVKQRTGDKDGAGHNENLYFRTSANSCQKLVFGAYHGKPRTIDLSV